MLHEGVLALGPACAGLSICMRSTSRRHDHPLCAERAPHTKQAADNGQQTTRSRQQAADNRQQTIGSKKQAADNRQEITGSRQQAAEEQKKQQQQRLPYVGSGACND